MSYRLEATPEGDWKLVFVVKEHEGVSVRRILFVGNKVFSDKELRKVVRTRQKGFLSFLTSSGKYDEEQLKNAGEADQVRTQQQTEQAIQQRAGQPEGAGGLEKQAQQQQSSSSSQGGKQSTKPMQDSMPGGGSGPGEVDQRRTGVQSGWGNCRPNRGKRLCSKSARASRPTIAR